MTHQQALLEDTCTFPWYTISLHKRCAAHIDKLEADVNDLAEVVAVLQAENQQADDIIQSLLRLIPNNAEALEIIKDTFHSTEGN
jgi:hypothetical protein